MTSLARALMAAVPLMIGCGMTPMPPLPADHPASPLAAEAPATLPFTALGGKQPHAH